MKIRSIIAAFALLVVMQSGVVAQANMKNASAPPRVTAEIIAVDNFRASDKHFYYRFKLKYPDDTISYGYVPVMKLELWYADLNNLVGSVLEFTPGKAPTPDTQKVGCSVINPKVIY